MYSTATFGFVAGNIISYGSTAKPNEKYMWFIIKGWRTNVDRDYSLYVTGSVHISIYNVHMDLDLMYACFF